MIHLMGEAWKNSRSTFTPIFTSGKMKAMTIFIEEVNKNLVNSIESELDSGKSEFELKENFGKYVT